ncbi:MAG: DUF72 domain-containing protein [Crocinitomicaceae bacterium]
MKFGKLEDPSKIDFSLPVTHPETYDNLKAFEPKPLTVHIGATKWSKSDLKGFYPRGTTDELSYYSQQFNGIELNASFYRLFPAEQYEKWRETSAEGFQFFPKVSQRISQFKRLKDAEEVVDEFVDGVVHLKEKLGTVFLQMMPNFAPKDFDRVEKFLNYWPHELVPLAFELRHLDWFLKPETTDALFALYKKFQVTPVVTDTLGFREIVHMRMTTPELFVRFGAGNHPSDYQRLDAWIDRIAEWHPLGLSRVNFFFHQKLAKDTPYLATYFAEEVNRRFNLNIPVPRQAGS